MADLLSKEKYEYYVGLLRDELIPAMGCTEPIAIAYASAKARATMQSVSSSSKRFLDRNNPQKGEIQW